MTAMLLATTLLLPHGLSYDGAWLWPVQTRSVEREFAPPTDPYGPGHRGVDLPGRAGETVVAVATGTVTFAGDVAGVATVTVDHGVERSTYQPVRATVSAGDAVQAGQPIGSLLAGHPSCRTTCLNLGRLRGDDYLDPVALLGADDVRLISPDGPPPSPPSWEPEGIVNLLGGPVTSPFGMRRHPVTGEVKLHDGVDLGAACGTPVPALLAGTVTFSAHRGAYGEQVELAHDDGRVTSYSHLSSREARAGDRVEAGHVIGRVGTTGMSTGCHLHLMLLIDGTPVDPLSAGGAG
ncbi:peptidoglycan DD-metalloendopeptidase family protein [Aeromicrobium sp. YIM 150415]|uniref:peptidoglycan DD-metalloendopeptidase family protein n=1 Tax=Aeromicrobium sp. YIM 150415 TaxID=2803912 RepID=UPI0019627937|nr:peptidoglycan DD-metalloendopeptidase family protein [Aeromicrobium sp. YIM 150415]MBM9462762.1 peptidoglycan DD-metalloendopeptidase family protein [Aeromicrobium sp. YIM 150415]